MKYVHSQDGGAQGEQVWASSIAGAAKYSVGDLWTYYYT